MLLHSTKKYCWNRPNKVQAAKPLGNLSLLQCNFQSAEPQIGKSLRGLHVFLVKQVYYYVKHKYSTQNALNGHMPTSFLFAFYVAFYTIECMIFMVTKLSLNWFICK